MPKRPARKLAVIDFETDPFLYGRKPEPFAAGFYDGETYREIWSANCVELMRHYLAQIETPLLIYAHNGGKFDFFYFVEQGLVENPIMIINGRLVKLGMGRHELRDSFSIIPVALAKIGAKLEIDYDKFEADVREDHKAEILAYLKIDCVELYGVVKAFNDRFGPMLTVGGTAIKELGKLHHIIRGDESHDKIFRPFYYGGRVSVFEPGISKAKPGKPFKVYDVNSMYPHVMRDFQHPHGTRYLTIDNPDIDAWGNVAGYRNRPYFASIEADNFKGALPTRTRDGLRFDQEQGEFLACSHEIRVALKHKLINIHYVNRAWIPLALTNFAAYVDFWNAEKIAGRESGDKVRELFAKFMLNSAYGKFGQNPAHYFDYFIKHAADPIPCCVKKGSAKCLTCPVGWRMHMDYGEWEIWRKPTPKPRYFDVAIAASITSAARAVLLDALQAAERPLYCDTDSIICAGLHVKLSETELGAWKLEAEGQRIGIAGKKMYALYDGKECVKMASKGADLDPADIFSLARGEAVIWTKDAPTFKLGHDEPVFIDRVITRTV